MIQKTVTISGHEVAFRSSATVPRLYRAKFKRDIFKHDILQFDCCFLMEKNQTKSSVSQDMGSGNHAFKMAGASQTAFVGSVPIKRRVAARLSSVRTGERSVFWQPTSPPRA